MAFNAASMMSMFTPTLKSMDFIVNKLKAAKSIEPGDLSGISDKILGSGGLSGLQNLLKNPSGGSGGGAKGSAQGAAQQANTAPPLNNAAATALTGLAGDIQGLIDQSAELMGLGSDTDGLLITAGLSQTADALGADHAFSTAVIMKPLNSESELAALSDDVWRISNDFVIRRTITAAQAAAQVQVWRDKIQAITGGSVAAITGLKSLAAVIKSVSMANAMYTQGGPEWQDAMRRAFTPEIRAVLDASNADLLKVD